MIQSLPILIALVLSVLPRAHASVDPDFFIKLKQKVESDSPELKVARAQSSQKSAQTYTSLTKWLPHVDLQLSQSKSKDYSILTGGALNGPSLGLFKPQEVELRRWTFVFNQSIYRRDVHAGLQTSRAEAELARAQLLVQEMQLDWRLRQLIGQYLLQQYQILNIEQAIELSRSQFKEVNLRFELGDKTKIDVLRSQVNVNTLESKKSSAEQARREAMGRLVEYVGGSEEDVLAQGLKDVLVTEEKVSIALRDLMDLDRLWDKMRSLIDDLSLHRVEKELSASGPRYISALREEELAYRRASLLTAQEFPDLVLQGNFNKQAPEWSDTFKEGQRSYSVSLVLTIPLFAGGRLVSSWSEQANAVRAAEAQADKNIEKIKNDVRNRIFQVQAQEKNLKALQAQWEQRQEIARLTKKSYELGKSTVTELLSSQNELLDSQLDLTQAKMQLALTLRELAWDLGVSL